MSPISGADLPLGVDHHALGAEEVVYHAPQVRHALGVEHHHPLGAEEVVCLRTLRVEQAIDTAICDPGVGVTRNHGAGVIHVPGAEQDTPDVVLGAEQLGQCQREDRSDDPDYKEQVVFHESDTETRTTAAFLKEKCSKRLESADRLTTRNTYALPKVPATKTSALDAYMKPEVSQNAKVSDRELGSIHTVPWN